MRLAKNMNIKPRTIVLVPGYMLDENLWSRFETYLPPHFKVHYASLNGGQTIRDIARHMSTYLPGKFTLIGFSLDGYIARQFAADFPERVESLVLIASSLREDTPRQVESKRQSIQSLSSRTFKGLSNHAIARSLHPRNASNLDMISNIQQMGCRLGFEAFVTQSSLLRQDIPAATLCCRTLVIASNDDVIRSMTEVKELVDTIPHASLRIITGSGHMVPLEQPQALANRVSAWLEDI